MRGIRGPGRVDNTALEARADVLTYTTAALDQDVEVIGEVGAEIWFRSSLPTPTSSSGSATSTPAAARPTSAKA